MIKEDMVEVININSKNDMEEVDGDGPPDDRDDALLSLCLKRKYNRDERVVSLGGEWFVC